MESQTLWSLLSQAGWTMFPLYGCSLVALAVIVHKLLQFRMDRVYAVDVLSLAAVVEPDELPALAEQLGSASPLARVMAVAARHASDGRVRAEGEAARAATAEIDRYESWMSLLSYVAQAAPLFGLLGTVLGMVDLFSSMQMAASEVSTATLSAGIWKALLTTAAGLIVAIPAIGAHLWLARTLELLQHRMEEGVGRLLARVP